MRWRVYSMVRGWRGWRCFGGFGGWWRAGPWRFSNRGLRAGGPAKCVCPKCGYEIPHVRGKRVPARYARNAVAEWRVNGNEEVIIP